jgi:hypothetical protein
VTDIECVRAGRTAGASLGSSAHPRFGCPDQGSTSALPSLNEDQAVFFPELPDYLARVALFKSNTGTREDEVCGLRWDWEVPVPELGTSVFLVPGDRVKNMEERLVVLNRIARSVIDSVRGMHSEYVFVHKSYSSSSPRPRSRRGTQADRANEQHGLEERTGASGG